MKVIDAADWDSNPERQILLGGLSGAIVVDGGELPDCVPRMAEAGLVEYRVVANIEQEAAEEPGGMMGRIVAAARRLRRGRTVRSTVYYLSLKDTGVVVAASLAPSEYLMWLVARHLFAEALLPVAVLTELDRRAGRSGYVVMGQIRQWAARVDWDELSRAPRPIDASGTAPDLGVDASSGVGTTQLVALLKTVRAG